MEESDDSDSESDDSDSDDSSNHKKPANPAASKNISDIWKKQSQMGN